MKEQIDSLSESAEIEWQCIMGGIHFSNWTFSSCAIQYALKEIQKENSRQHTFVLICFEETRQPTPHKYLIYFHDDCIDEYQLRVQKFYSGPKLL